MRRILIAAMIIGVTGCHREKTERTGEKVDAYRLVGKVRRVDAEAGKVTLAHEAIPGFMPAMTMTFQVREKATLEDVREGDKVAATLKVYADRSELEGLDVTEPAQPAAMKLVVEGGRMELRAPIPRLTPGQEVPDFAMTDQDGNRLNLSDLRGEVVAITFIYTRCPLPDFCPKMDSKFHDLASMIASVKGRSDRVRLLSISFDPEHDTPEVLRSHAKLRGAIPPLWRFAVASHEELRKVAEPLGLVYGPRPDEIAHNLSTAVIGPDGRLARLESGGSWAATDLFRTIRGLLAK